MESPGWFTQTVGPDNIELAYDSDTWCIYKGHQYYVCEGDGDRICIEQLKPGLIFGSILPPWRKWVDAAKVTSIWVTNSPWENFKHIKIPPQKIKGEIPVECIGPEIQ